MAKPLISDEGRVATAALRGYYYQLLFTCQRWAQLETGEALYCEGNEDLDVVGGEGGIEAVQLKDIMGTLTEASRPVYSTVLNFLLSYVWHRQRNSSIRLVLRTTARLAAAQEPLLHRWLLGEERDCAAFCQDLRQLIETRAKRPKAGEDAETSQYGKALQAIEWLQTRGLVGDFMRTTEWSFGECSLEDLKAGVADAINGFAAKKGYEAIDPQIVADMVLRYVLKASTAEDIEERRLDVFQLEGIVVDFIVSKECWDYAESAHLDGNVLFWTSPPNQGPAVSMIAAFDDIRDLDRRWKAGSETQLSRPGQDTVPLSLNSGRGLDFIATATFAVFAYIWDSAQARPNRDSYDDLVHLLDQLSARRDVNDMLTCNGLEIHKEWLPARYKNLRLAPAESIACGVLDVIGSAICTWAVGRGNQGGHGVLAFAGRKLRGLYDRRSGAYYSQKNWPFSGPGLSSG